MVQSRAKVSAADDVSPRIAYTVPGDDAGHELSQEERESLVNFSPSCPSVTAKLLSATSRERSAGTLNG